MGSGPDDLNQPDTERRRLERTTLKVPVDYSGVDAFFSEFASNINEGGLFIETDHPGEMDEVVQLQIQLPTLEEPIQVDGRIAWISDGKADQPAGMGIEFVGLPSELRLTLDRVVRQLRVPE